ncbi:TPA: transporter YfdV [Providencia rettgeri]|uniref:transporter YfdV n=1 Tax=Providencia sp. Me31A TaxID=3392637 RepID=UPI0038C31DD1
MFLINILMGDLLPIIAIIIVGYISGKKNIFNADQTQVMNKLVLTFALPTALFLAIVKSNRDMILSNAKLSLVSLVVILFCFFLSYFCCYKLFKNSHKEAGVCALIAGSPTIGFLGFAVLQPIFGDIPETGVVVGIISIIVNAITIPIGLCMINFGDKNSDSWQKTLLDSFKKPVVWAPILATILVFLGIKVPSDLYPTFALMGSINSGLAVFASGLTLSQHVFKFNIEITWNTILKMIIMPALLLVVGLLFKMESIQIQMMVIAGSLPPAFSGTIISSRLNIYTETGTASLAVSILSFIITAPIWIYVTKLFTA